MDGGQGIKESGMSDNELALREEIITTCLRMNALGINQGTSGNVSVRWRQGLLVTPSGTPYERLEPEDIVYLDQHGNHAQHQTPSSEWRFHRDIYRHRAEVAAVVHTHSMYATAIAIKGLDIPALHYMIAAAGGPTIRCAPYATFGTQALSDNALAALEDRKACLLGNHGVIATGTTLYQALWLAREVETLAQQYWLTLQLGGANILSDEEVARVVEKFKSYGVRS
jgi:L-fuculose-phosphate aldolase